MSINITRRPIAVLDLPKRIGDMIAFAQSVANALKGNVSFPTPTPTLTAFEADIAALQAAEAIALTRAHGAAEARDVKLEAVMNDLEQLLAYVQTIATSDPSTAAAVIESAGLRLRKLPERNKAALSVTPGEPLGTVTIVAKAVARRAAYEWQYSLDQTTWTSAPVTLQAKTTLSGLTAGTAYFFRFRAVGRTGEGSLSPVVACFIPGV